MPGLARIIRSFKRPLRSWLGPKPPADTSPAKNKTTNQHTVQNINEPTVDISLMLANFAGGLKGLPYEIVDEVLAYLVGDLPALKACSLTCKVLLRSARPIIHRRLRIDGWARLRTLDEHESQAANLARFRPLLVAAERGLTCYTRELTINIGKEFKPENLCPFLPQFQTFTRVTSLSLHYFDPTPFLPVFEPYFGHLAQQIQSLEFIRPSGSHNDLLHFISRFPNLDNLGFGLFPRYDLYSPEFDIPTIRGLPTLRGTLRVEDATMRTDGLFRSFKQLPSGLRFRSVEFCHCTGINPNIVIQECASTIQYLTHVIHTRRALLEFDFSACSHLQTIEIRIEFPLFNFHELMGWFASTLSTITSPEFHRFVLVIEDAHYRKVFGNTDVQSAPNLVDQTLLSLSQRTGMKLVVKGRTLHSGFRDVMEKAFPLMASAGVLEFEPNDSPPCLHWPMSRVFI